MTERKTEPDLICYISEDDLETVKKRIPEEYQVRLRDVFINYKSNGVRTLGSVKRRGRRDIELHAVLPYRVSLGRFLVKGQSALTFGTSARGQWMPWAVRRFLLYDVFLHELGHLQVIDPESKNYNRKFASETLAQEFADNLRQQLWMKFLNHPDPIHNPPQADELSVIPLWQSLNKKQRFHFVKIAINAPHPEIPDLSEFGKINKIQKKFLFRALCFKIKPLLTAK